MDVNENELIGNVPLKDAPVLETTDRDCMARKKLKRDGDVVKDDNGDVLFGGYCKCWPGKGTDTVGEGRCSLHGGNGGAPAGPANGNYKNGLNSTVMRPEDEAMLEAIEEMSTAAKLEEMHNLQYVKLYRAVESMESSDRNDFWDAFARLVEKVEIPEETDLKSLAQMLSTNDRQIREYMDLIRKTAKDLHKITDGESLNVEHEVDSDSLEELQNTLESAYGNG